MNRPSLPCLIAGHPLGCLATCLTGLLIFMASATGPQPDGAGMLTGIAACCWAALSRKRRNAWIAWKREWVDASGDEPARAGRGGARWALALLSLAALASPFIWVALFPNDDASTGAMLVSLAFTVALLGWIIVAMRALLRAIRKRSTRQRQRPHVIVPALHVPLYAAGPEQIRAGLPDYCKRLLSRKHDARGFTE